ncbi:hypothetical protein LOTGIDRAFT_153854, partial [Lottia gigantea]
DDDVISSRNEEESSEDSMKLRKKDLSLFGFCPSQDELFLVLCEKCNKSIKPQAFKQHLVKRHGVKDSHARRSSSTSHSSHSSSSKYISPKKEEKRSSSSSSQAPLTCPVPTKASVKQTPPNIAALARARQNARDKSESSAPVKEKGEKLNDSPIKVKKSQTLPIVKVERISEQLSSKKPSTISLDSDSLASDINKSSIKTEIDLEEKTDIFMPELLAELEKVPEKPPVLHPIKPVIPKLTKSFSSTTLSSTPISKVLSSMSSKSTSSGSSKSLGGASTLSSKSNSGVSSSKLGSVSSSRLSSNALSSSKSSSGASTLSSKSNSGASSLSSKSSSSIVSTASNVTSTTSVVTIKSDTKPDFSHTMASNILTKPFNSVSMAPKPTSLSITSNTTKSGSSTKLVKPFKEKFLPCKDREYDSSKHCGVFIEDIQKSCTRSLTCKTHALSLRRAVKGRIKPFDDLLKEHRIAKEALLKAKALAAGLPPPTSKYSYLLEASEAEAAAAAAAAPATSSGANSSHSKPNQSSSITSPHRSSKPHNKLSGPAFQRISVSGVFAPQTSICEDNNTLVYGQNDGIEEELDCRETHFINRHPRPAAICTFGARTMSGARYSVFNHRPDFMRAAFISAIERHLHPPPHKKLCVESNLPKDSHVVTNAVDPYEFMDPGIAGSAAHSFNSMFNSQMRTGSMKQKSKQTLNRTSKQALGSRSPGSINSLPTVTNMNPAKRKRNISSQGSNPSPVISQNFTNVIQSLPLNTNNNNNNNNSNPIATIAIPGMNLTGTTIGQFNTAAGKTGQLQLQKNNIINKDGQVNFVLTGIDPSLTRNGCVSIATSQFGQMITTDDKNSKKSRTSVAGTKSNNKLVNTIEGIKTFPNNVFTLPQNAVYMDGGLQGTLLQVPNLTPTSNNTIMSLATPVVTTQQLQDSTLTNGVHSATDKVLSNRQKFVQTGPKSITAQGVPLLQTSGSLNHGQLFTSQTQLNPIQVKSSNINMNKKVAMQPVSVTIPLLSQSNFSALGAPQTQHTFLLRTSTDDSGQRQEIHLQQPLSNSSTNLIS